VKARFLFDLCAQTPDVHVDRAFIAVKIETPQALEQPFAHAGARREHAR